MKVESIERTIVIFDSRPIKRETVKINDNLITIHHPGQIVYPYTPAHDQQLGSACCSASAERADRGGGR